MSCLSKMTSTELNIVRNRLDADLFPNLGEDGDNVFKIDVNGELAGAINISHETASDVCYFEIFVFPEYESQWATRGFLKQLYSIAFNDFNVNSVCTVSKNPKIGKMMAQEGYTAFHIDETGIHFVLHKDKCRWI